jgi:hypothetical protein
MRNYVQEHFDRHPPKDPTEHYHVRPAIFCVDGTIYSVQASGGHHCSPKKTGAKEYFSVEVFSGTRRKDPEGWISVKNMNRRIHRHGGPK